jgi:hypothetical protein
MRRPGPLNRCLILLEMWDDGMVYSAVRRLTPLLAMLLTLALSVACFGSGNQQIAFVSEVAGEPEIFLLDLETGETTPMTSNNGRDFNPLWSPDRKQIVYLTDEPGDQEKLAGWTRKRSPPVV